MEKEKRSFRMRELKWFRNSGKECIELNKRFFTYHEKKRPYIILKWAESGDGFLDKDFKPTAISNSLVNQRSSVKSR
jgi:hypothetical protein